MKQFKLSIGFAHYDDYHGAYFTIQDIRKELIFNNRKDLLDKIQFVVVNNIESGHSKALKELKNHVPNMKYVDFFDNQGTSSTRNKVIEEADGEFVLVMDCHVLLCPTTSAITQLFKLMEENPQTEDLYSGPLVYDDMNNISTHFNDKWGAHMWGSWGSTWKCNCDNFLFTLVHNNGGPPSIRECSSQKECSSCPKCGKSINLTELDKTYQQQGKKADDKPFEIFAQGLGLFFTRKDSWLKFNQHTRGFGGEECYIHAKYRKFGRKNICLPFLKWVHRFNRPDGVPYRLTLEDRIKNYLLELREIDLDLAPAKKHFVEESGVSESEWNSILEVVKQTYPDKPTISEKPPEVTQPPTANLAPFITCICATYKRPEALSSLIKCFEKQNYPKDRCELLILDDAAQYTSCQGENWRIISQKEKMNIPSKLNKLASLASDETNLYVILEDDDIYLPSHLISMVRFLRKGSKQFFSQDYSYATHGSVLGNIILFNSMGLSHSSWAYSKELWNDVGGYDETSLLDWITIMKDKCLKVSEVVKYEQDVPTYVYRWARAGFHISKFFSTRNEVELDQRMEYLGYIPVEKIENLKPEFDEETKAVYEKLNLKVD